MEFRAADFGENFVWGVASAAYQIEGAYQSDGKGPSIWDTFTATAGKIVGGEHGRRACDFYNRYIQDIILMHSLNIPAFRFSLSWSRIFPDGTGRVNPAGVEYYDNLINFCLELGIEPWVTLYHWDLPQALQQQGGWCNRQVVDWFQEYVRFCISHFGDRVKRWIVLNEPMVFTGAGHFLGLHAPGMRSLKGFMRAAHHAALCQAEGGRIIRSERGDCKVGTTFSCSQVDAFTEREEDIAAAQRIDAILNRFFIEPLLGLGYPLDELKFLSRMEEYILPNDESMLRFDMDFVGVQNYTREVARHSYVRPLINAQVVSADKRNVETTLMNWEVYPEGVYKMLKKFAVYPNIPELMVTENGAAFPDEVQDGVVNDVRRKRYLQEYMEQILRAKKEGVRIGGHFIWTFTDNFEWAEGYRPRFGLVYIDFKTQRRIVKQSGYWYRDFLRGNTSGQTQTLADAIGTMNSIISQGGYDKRNAA
jgi:beta-glucosidase